MNQLMDQQDALDKLERIKKLAEAAALQRALNQAEEELKAQEKGPAK
jgi:hypothetical protein